MPGRLVGVELTMRKWRLERKGSGLSPVGETREPSDSNAARLVVGKCLGVGRSTWIAGRSRHLAAPARFQTHARCAAGRAPTRSVVAVFLAETCSDDSRSTNRRQYRRYRITHSSGHGRLILAPTIRSLIEVIDRYARRGCSRMAWTVQGRSVVEGGRG